MKRPTRAQLSARVRPARLNSVSAFVISIVTGRDPSEVDPTDLLASWGYDDRNIDSLGDTINNAHWHNIQVTDQEIEKCKTIQNVIDLVAKKVRRQVQAAQAAGT